MSLEKATAWLQSRPTSIPALSVNLREISRLIEDEKHTARLARIAIHDPALSLALLTRVNIHRGQGSGKAPVESPLAAISLLGDHVSHTLVGDHPSAEKALDDKHQLVLYEQLIERSLHNETLVDQWAIEQGYKQTENFKTAALLGYLGELFCCAHDFDSYLAYLRKIRSGEDEATVFGFHFDELTEVLVDQLNLPEMISAGLSGKQRKNPVEQLLFHCAQIGRLAESGWRNPQLCEAMQSFAETLQTPVDRISRLTHQFTVLAARDSYVLDAWTPAARLVLSDDRHWAHQLSIEPPSEKPVDPMQSVVTAPSNAPDEPIIDEALASFNRATSSIRDMIKNPESTQSAVVNACLKGLFQEMRLARVSLLMLSADKNQLQNRLSLGLDKESGFRQFGIEVERAGLLKVLMQKPQAIWITPDSLKKYQKMLPATLLASIMTDNFMAMSLFIGNQPIGIVYADQRQAKSKIDAELFSRFKQLISLTSKALTLLAKR